MAFSPVAELPYVRGAILRGTDDDVAKLRAAWRIVERRHREETLFDFSGLERSLDVGDVPAAALHDDIAPALFSARLTELALEHLGGVPGRDDVFVANRLTASAVAAMQVLVTPGATAVGVSPSYTHPAIARAVRLAGGDFREGGPLDGASLVVLTRLAVTYEALAEEQLLATVEESQARGIPVFVDDAGGARVGPAVLGQPKMLELGVELGATGLDKYGTSGPRLGLLAGRAELVAAIRARGIELGLEARPMLYPAVVRSLEQYRPERVRELAAATSRLGDALERRLGGRVARTPVAVKVEGEDLLAEAAARAGIDEGESGLVPYEATAAIAMLLLREYGVLTVHFAALPPGTSALLLKFVPPETLERFGGAERFAAVVDESLDALAGIVGDEQALRRLLVGRS
jgi:L-seryl-tRNA(Ser) seleniumtransferase